LKNYILSFSLIIFVFLNSSCSRDEISLSLFLGPQEGEKVILKHSNEGVIMEIIGVSSEADNIRIKENTILPDDYPRPSFAPKIIEGNYTISVSGNKLLKTGGWGENILLQKPLQPNMSKWTVPALVGKLDSETENPSSEPTKFKCSIFDRRFMEIEGKKRLSVTSECNIEAYKDILQIERYKYAEGLGLIEIASLYKDSDGTIHEAGKFSLIEIKRVDNN